MSETGLRPFFSPHLSVLILDETHFLVFDIYIYIYIYIYITDRLCNVCDVHDGMQVILVHGRGGEGRGHCIQANSCNTRSGTRVM